MRGMAVLSLVLTMLRGERRRASRYAVLLSARIVAPAGAVKVTLHDISRTGALVRGDALPRVGTHVTLTRGELELEACVVWKGGNRAGLLFRQRLPADRLFAMVHESNRTRAVPAGDAIAA